MPLTYDQKSEIRIAFDEAYVPPDRRRDLRVKYRAEAELCSWKRNRQGLPFRARIEDFSPSGVGLVHGEPLPVGSDYLIKIPRPSMDELVVLLTVVRCRQQEDGTYLVGLEISSVMDRTEMGRMIDALKAPRRLTSRRTRVLFLMLGVFGIGFSLIL